MAKKKLIYCRFEGCKHKGFTSRAGRLYHEKKYHGRGFLDTNTKSKLDQNTEHNPKESTINHDVSNEFVNIEEVKFIMAKDTKNPKKKESNEYDHECGACGHEYNGDAKYCPDCGCEFE